jgi:hypothetical protein
MTRATGTFDVKLSPQAVDEKADASLGRMSIDKQFHGNLEGSSTGRDVECQHQRQRLGRLRGD